MAAVRSTALVLGLLLVSGAAQASQTIAVLPLDARLTGGRMDSGAQASLEEMLLDVVSGALAHEDWVVLSSEKTLQALKARGVAPEACDGGCRMDVARALDADDFVSSAVELVDGRFTLSVRVIETSSGSVRATEHMEGRNASALRKALEANTHRLFVHAGLLGPVIAGAGILRVDSTPSEATVLLDGESIGKTPLRKSLAAGKYEVTLQHEGYEPRVSEATVHAKADTSISVSLAASQKTPPPAPEHRPDAVYRIPLGDAPVKGAPTAKVTLVEWADFECPYCERAQAALKRLEETFGKDLRIVFKNYPLPRPHKHAQLAAEAALAAGEQGKFWEMHDELFQDRHHLERLDLEERAFEIGLDMKRFEDALDNHRFASAVEHDQREGESFGVTGTPVFFINGRPLIGNQPFENFKAVVLEELAHADKLLAAGTAPGDLYDAETRDGLLHADAPKQPQRPALPPVQPPTARVELGDSPVRGPQDALVTIVEWADFQCPFSGRVVSTLQSLLQTYPKEVRLVFKHAPLPFHPNALPAALAAEAARAQGRFWEFHDLAFQHQSDLSPAKYEEWARALHLDLDRFRKDRDDPATRMRVMADAEYGSRVGANGTPTFFIDGRELLGAQPLETFKGAVEDELRKAHELLQSGVKLAELYERLLDANVRGTPSAQGRVQIDIGQSPAQGPVNAPVTIVEFSDFQCPFCGKVHSVLAELMGKYDGRIRLVWKNQALPSHPAARSAAKAALAAAEQGRFWEMHDMLLSHQDKLAPAYYEAWAHDMSLDIPRFRADMGSAKYDAVLDADSRLGNALGASGTPTFFINGQKVLGAIPLEEFEKLIDQELAGVKPSH